MFLNVRRLEAGSIKIVHHFAANGPKSLAKQFGDGETVLRIHGSIKQTI